MFASCSLFVATVICSNPWVPLHNIQEVVQAEALPRLHSIRQVYDYHFLNGIGFIVTQMVLFEKLDVPWVLVLIAITEEFRIWDKSKLHIHMLPFNKILCLGVPSEDFLKWIRPSLRVHFAFSIHLLIKFYLQLTLSVT